MKLHKISIDGALLERGFWLYVWRVKHNEQTLLYVGHTANGSSHASSPCSRLAELLDVRPSARLNAYIRAAGFDPVNSAYELLAIGPLFPEQTTIQAHRKFRDIIIPLECALVLHLSSCGHRVIGKYPKAKPYDTVLFQQVTTFLQNIL